MKNKFLFLVMFSNILMLVGCVSGASNTLPTSITPLPLKTKISTRTPKPKTTLTSTLLPTKQGVITATQPEKSPSPTANSPSITTSIPTVQMEGLMLTTLTANKDYIFYTIYDSAKQQTVLWAINPINKKPVSIKHGDGLSLGSLSPNGKYRLFYGKGVLFIATPDGTHLSQVFRSENHPMLTAAWINDSTILFNAFEDIALPPISYMLNIDTGRLTQLDTSGRKAIQAVFPDLGSWIEVDWAQELEIVGSDGNRQPFMRDFEIADAPWSDKYIQWIASTQEFVFIGKKSGDYSAKLWAVSRDSGSARILFDFTDGAVEGVFISPNEQYVGFARYTPENQIVFVNIKTGQVAYQWASPYTIGNFNLLWSPDSHYVALPYAGPHPFQGSNEVHRGVQIMNIYTGKAEIVLVKNIYEMNDWFNIKH